MPGVVLLTKQIGFVVFVRTHLRFLEKRVMTTNLQDEGQQNRMRMGVLIQQGVLEPESSDEMFQWSGAFHWLCHEKGGIVTQNTIGKHLDEVSLRCSGEDFLCHLILRSTCSTAVISTRKGR